MTFAMEVVCDLVRWAIGLGSIASPTLGGGGSTVCVTLDLVRRAMGSYFSRVDGTLGADGAELDVRMKTLGGPKASACVDPSGNLLIPYQEI